MVRISFRSTLLNHRHYRMGGLARGLARRTTVRLSIHIIYITVICFLAFFRTTNAYSNSEARD